MLKQPSSEYRGFRPAGIRLSEEMLPQLQKLATRSSRRDAAAAYSAVG